MDLRSWDFTKDGPVSLQGECFYFDDLLDAGTFVPEMLQEARWGQMRGNRLADAQGDIKNFRGFTRIIKIRLPAGVEGLEIDSLRTLVPMRIYAIQFSPKRSVRRILQTDEHFTDDNTIDWQFQRIPESLHSLPSEDEIYILIHSRMHAKAVASVPTIGLTSQIQMNLQRDIAETFLITGCYCVIMLYCFFLYSQRRTDKIQLVAGLITLGVLLKYLGSDLALSIFPGLSTPNITYSLIFGGYAISNLSTLGLISLVFHPRFAIKAKIPLATLGIGISLHFALQTMDLQYFNFSFWSGINMSIGFAMTLLAIVNNGYALFMSLRQRGVYLYLGIASVFVSTSFVLDVLIASSFLNFPYTSHYSNLVFCLAITLMISRNFAETYKFNEKLLQEVQEKEKARTLFFHNTSHELRTPLNGIIGFMQLILQGRYGKLDTAVEDHIGKCLRLALSLKNQVNTILDLAKSKKGQLILTNSLVSLPDLAAEADDLAEGLRLRKTSSAFSFKRVWGADQDTFVSDREKLSMLLRNLLGNAFKFADPQRPNQVSLRLERDYRGLIIEVQDTGIGIPDNQKDRVFEEFQQVAGDERRAYEGTGLGLAMVRDIVKLMGGSLDLASKPGEGSCFTVVLPEQSTVHLKQPIEFVPLTFAPSSLPAFKKSKANLAQGPHILVVDDHELNCELLRDILQEEGYFISVAFGGEEALKFMRNQHPDLILLDMMMPYVSGEDVIKAMQKDALMQDIPVILITARASEDDRIFGLSLGADDYLAKPIHQEELLFRVRNILHRVETAHHAAAIEERERLAQLGQLMREMSHELKNVFQMDRQDGSETQQSMESILRRLPLNAEPWIKGTSLIARDERINASQINMEIYAFSSKQDQTDRSLRYLRSVVAQLPMEDGERQTLWNAIQRLEPAIWKECEQSIHLIRNFISLREQNRYAEELIMNVLDYSRHEDTEIHASIMTVVTRIAKLIQPKLSKHKIKFEMAVKPQEVRMNPSHLMQICLNLLVNACDAVMDLLPGERWIRLSVQTEGANTLLCFENAGPPIPAEIVNRLFQENKSTKGQHGNGLGLFISQKLAMRVLGHLDYDRSADHPTFILRLQASQEVPDAAKIA